MPPKAPSACYILAGPETGRRESFVRDLVSTCRELDGAEPEYHRLYASDTGPEALTGLLMNGSLFSSRKIVEYRGAEAVSGKGTIDTLVRYTGSPAEQTVLLRVTETYSIAKALETAVGAAGKKMFWELRETEKPAWLRERLGKDDLSAGEAAIDAFLELVENETSAMESACLMLAACFPPGTRLDADQMEAALSRSRREDAFSLFDRMADGDLDSSLCVLDSVLSDRQSDPSQVLAGLIWSFRKLGKLTQIVDEGNTEEEAFRLEKVTSKTGQKKFRAAMKRYSAGDCARIIRAASETEASLRGGLAGGFARPLLQLFIRSCIQHKGGGLILSGWKEQEYYLSERQE